MSAYFEALEAHNDSGDGKKPISDADAKRLREFNKAHGVV
jgi:hypothetical protein